MLLAYPELIELVKLGVIIGAPKEAVNASSIDLTLADVILAEEPQRAGRERKPVDLMAGETPWRTERIMTGYGSPEGGYYDLKPGEFILASTQEMFYLPNHISAEYMQKSSLARSGLEHLAAGWCDAGWNGSTLTLELQNVNAHSTLRLRPGMKIGQMKFFQHTEVPTHASYANRGQYNRDVGVTNSKGAR